MGEISYAIYFLLIGDDELENFDEQGYPVLRRNDVSCLHDKWLFEVLSAWFSLKK